uniref:Uncharacterized protein n=1 Tax=Eutreptiella gymnastica TaxID=73025 RepID=A0A7S1I8C3_9EUGL|mmetsp:Transcript_13801/g.24638  ORF Transcript_13801/g.24638 Transcript_13801/m.24638 type:complete len:513 (+) Transcript_13801:41-1579(+)
MDSGRDFQGGDFTQQRLFPGERGLDIHSRTGYAEVTRTSYGEKMGNACGGVFAGIIMFLLSFPLLWWNEGRTLHTMQSLEDGLQAVREVACYPIDPSNEGQLVHISCSLEGLETLLEADLGVSVQAAFLRRTVEMYQYREQTRTESTKQNDGSTKTVTHYTYREEWAAHPIDSQHFHVPDACLLPSGGTVRCSNPRSWPLDSNILYSTTARAGAFDLSQNLLQLLSSSSPVRLNASTVDYKPSPRHPPPHLNQENTHLVGNYLYTGNPNLPLVGDMRVRWTASTAKAVSVLAKQQGSGFVPWASRGRARYTLQLLSEGFVSASDMIDQALLANSIVAYLLRILGWILMVVGLVQVGGPLGVMHDIIPFCGPIIGEMTMVAVWFAAFAVATPLSIITICLAWLRFRPWVSIPLVACVAVLLYYLQQWRAQRMKASAGAAPPGYQTVPDGPPYPYNPNYHAPPPQLQPHVPVSPQYQPPPQQQAPVPLPYQPAPQQYQPPPQQYQPPPQQYPSK